MKPGHKMMFQTRRKSILCLLYRVLKNAIRACVQFCNHVMTGHLMERSWQGFSSSDCSTCSNIDCFFSGRHAILFLRPLAQTTDPFSIVYLDILGIETILSSLTKVQIKGLRIFVANANCKPWYEQMYRISYWKIDITDRLSYETRIKECRQGSGSDRMGRNWTTYEACTYFITHWG